MHRIIGEVFGDVGQCQDYTMVCSADEESCGNPPVSNDLQCYRWYHAAYQQKHRVAIDSKQRLMASMSDVAKYTWQLDGKLRIESTGAQPLLLHTSAYEVLASHLQLQLS